jgi:predicted nucleotide-binding protein (sugar kinase/HSP70/actin superfamily)
LKTGARIGIPRALLYYRYGGIWKELLTAAGCEVIVSPRTTESIQNLGLGRSVCDLCLPVKVLFGHVCALKDDVDALFIPRYISVESKAFLCPKFIGLPDMVRAAIRNLPVIIDPVMDLKNGKRGEFIRDLNNQLGTGRADREAQQRIIEKPVRRDFFFGHGEMTVAVAGRPYLVLDDHMNKGIIRHLNELGIKAFYFIPDLFSVEKTMNSLPKWVYWSMGKEVVTSVNSMLNNRGVHGVINLVNSACGPDSFMVELINRSFDLGRKPYLSVTIDEHTSDVGLQTRIEAFLDMAMKRNTAAGRSRA